ncbi:MAG: YigZ family protein [Desulfitobacterium hafniense]|nr:YigZ family protein [Desulfitobacterium hafniense]
MQSYYTVTTTEIWEQVIDKSRFIGIVCPVTDVEEVEIQLLSIKEKYPNARHYCYAYRLYDGHLEKSTDDGEPQGTGGRPILEILQHRKVWNVLVVVVRYFGGILLGTGGLTRAYGGTARQVIDKIHLDYLVPHVRFFLTISYTWYEPLRYQFKMKPWIINEEEFLADIRLEVLVPLEDQDKFIDWINDFTQRQAIIQKLEVILRSPKVF